MTATIPAPTRTNNKLSGTFYPLQREELIALRKSRLINNAAYVHLALRMSNPFCDCPIELIPKDFAITWSIPESSVNGSDRAAPSLRDDRQTEAEKNNRCQDR